MLQNDQNMLVDDAWLGYVNFLQELYQFKHLNTII